MNENILQIGPLKFKKDLIEKYLNKDNTITLIPTKLEHEILMQILTAYDLFEQDEYSNTDSYGRKLSKCEKFIRSNFQWDRVYHKNSVFCWHTKYDGYGDAKWMLRTTNINEKYTFISLYDLLDDTISLLDDNLPIEELRNEITKLKIEKYLLNSKINQLSRYNQFLANREILLVSEQIREQQNRSYRLTDADYQRMDRELEFYSRLFNPVPYTPEGGW